MTPLLRRVCFVCLFSFICIDVVSAATITVTSTANTGAGTLRAAMSSAVSGDTIDFAVPLPATITLSSQLFAGSKDLYIRGPGADQLTISGNNTTRIFSFNALTIGSTVSGLTIRNGAPGGNSGGGILLSGGALAVIGCVITNNSAISGGGIYAGPNSRLTVVDSVVSNNVVTGVGGGISGPLLGAGPTVVTLVRSTVSGNSSTSAGGQGGGIWAGINTGAGNSTNTSLNLINSPVTDNHTANGPGGGIFANGIVSMQGGSLDANTGVGGGGGLYSTGNCSLTDAVVRGNSITGAASNAGGIYSSGALTLVRCTVSGNSVAGGSGTSSGGGGLYNIGTVTATNCTFSGNSIGAGAGNAILNGANTTVTLESCTIAYNVCNATTGGAGVYSGLANATVTCHSNLMAKNTGGSTIGGGVGFDVGGTFVSAGHNLIGSNGSGGSNFINGFNNDKVGTSNAPIDPLLDPLADNGGPTFTHALQSGSPALDAGEAAIGIATDQRGFPRYTKTSGAPTLLGGDNSDIGAFEFGNTALRITSITRPADGSIVIQGIGLPNVLHTVQATPDILTAFSPLLPIFSDSTGYLVFQDPDAAMLSERFYRFTYP